ncbi:uncharacterized protein N7484_009379 [Penicillium longicatenatum]|uniref:uncharacterized protein n=1 Tax=Penicillium longicatenatum TaxID=1561947 RepID=UPI0025470C93|nr:uncharacterized protein N7484_009379 [Penicillium longicatenatum]KAJ5636066.1 hypothetical protein N7484_009379 [Penicillium longicatenatum]
MAKVIFTAWKNKSQLAEVRSEFYPSPSYEGPDLRSHACAVVEAWKLRGNVPHHVEATALLTDAILHDDAQINSIFSIRATYSAAFCRFVTGLVDSKVQGPRKTMFQRAMDLGLPASFVELRHEATHREPPSLVVLRKASQRSLEWLWDNYWAEIDDLGFVSNVDHDDSASVQTALTSVLREFSTGSRSTEPQAKKRKRDQEISISTDLVSICGNSIEAVRSLPTILLDEFLLVGSERKIGESINDHFEKWDPVLQKITEHHPSFLMYLSEALVHKLIFDATRESPMDGVAEAYFLWLTHIWTSSSWESQQLYCSRSYILSACDENPNYWAKMLSDRLREREGVRKNKSSSRRSSQGSSVKKTALKNGNSPMLSGVDEKLLAHGWGPVEKWDSRALGVASAH